MDHNEDNDVKKALDDIFGSDFIEIDSGVKNNDSEVDLDIPEDNVLQEEKQTEDYFKESDLENNTLNINIPVMLDDEIPKVDQQDIKSETTVYNNLEEVESNQLDITDNTQINKNTYSKKALLLYFIIGIVLGTILILLVVNKNNNTEKKINCTYKAEDTGFKTTDEYTITYLGNKLIYIEGEYVYTAKTDEFKQQIDYIKEEKLPVIINSNGMSGFTHNYEISDNYYKVSSYYDITLFDFDIVDKNNPTVTPISYVELNSKTTLNSLKNNLEKNGYKCVNTN